jgi:hypothetical protein
MSAAFDLDQGRKPAYPASAMIRPPGVALSLRRSQPRLLHPECYLPIVLLHHVIGDPG